MRRKLKPILFVTLAMAQILIHRYTLELRFNVDLLYLILLYISIKSGFMQTILSAAIIGWVTDFFSAGVVGVFGFSRVFSCFWVNQFARYIDLTRNHFVFLLIALSLAFSNFIANLFLHLIYGYPFEVSLLLYQPLVTAAVGLLIVSPSRVKEILNVY